MRYFSPLILNPLPSLVYVVLMETGSLPASGSVRA